jgi:hypothetical protein
MDSSTYRKGENQGVSFQTKLKKLTVKNDCATYLLEDNENDKPKSTFEVNFTFDVQKGKYDVSFSIYFSFSLSNLWCNESIIFIDKR